MSGGSVNRMYEEFAKDHVINCRMYSLPCYRGRMDVPRKPRCWQPALWISRWESPITKSINCRINDVYAETFCIDVYGLHGYCARHYNGTARGSKRNAKYGGKISTKMSKRGVWIHTYCLQDDCIVGAWQPKNASGSCDREVPVLRQCVQPAFQPFFETVHTFFFFRLLCLTPEGRQRPFVWRSLLQTALSRKIYSSNCLIHLVSFT